VGGGVAYRSQPAPGQGRAGELVPETRFEAGDVVVVVVPGEPDSLAAAEIRLLQGDEIRGSVTAILRFDWF